jgi:hypothetical protein
VPARQYGTAASGHDRPGRSAGLDPLPLEVCLRLPESVPVGRVSFYADGEVVTLPVNHGMDGQDVVSAQTAGRSCQRPNARTTSRSKLMTTIRGRGLGGAFWSKAARERR